MNPIQTIFASLLLLVSANNYAQLSFCTGSKGDPVFSENFGNGVGASMLPPGITTYLFNPTPNDNYYALINHSNFFQPSWHVIPDHTPDATNGPNGKMMIVNGASIPSDFFKKTVTGLCVNTTFEFSAWLINLYNSASNICVGAAQIPINVRFEIWNSTETTLLASGDTGNIFGTPTPLWQQFAIAFTTGSETSVVLKMKNNGAGGCGNDLAIDDIEFRACADLTTVGTSPATPGNTFTSCTSPVSVALGASTASATAYFYQWQSSTDGTTWTDIPGENNATYTPSVTTRTYFRVRAAQDLANLGNLFCSTASNIFTIDVLPSPAAASNDGDQTICTGVTIPALSVTVPAGTGVNWYSLPSGGTLLQANSTTYTPTTAGTYYAETYNTTSNCIGPRTAVQLTVVATPDVNISAPASICSGNNALIGFSGTPNAVVTYTVNGGTNQTITLNASGTASLNPALTANTTYTLVSVNLGTCSRLKTDTVTVTVNGSATATVSTTAQVCHGSSATIHFDGTPNATVTYFVNTGGNLTIPLDASGDADIVIPSVTAATTYTLVKVDVAGVCSQTLTQSVTVSPVALPTASVTASPLVICSGQNSTITFNGTPNATVTYKVNGGANQTINLGASGSATLNPTLTANTTYTLVSAALPAPNACSNTLGSSAMVTVNALPTASISSPAPIVCSGSAATVNFSGTPNATITYSVGSSNQSITLNAAGNASVTIANLTATTVYTLIDVTSTGPNGCTKTLAQPPVTLSATALPTASITANPLAVCSGQSSTIRISGTPNAVVTYTVNGGANQTTTLNGSGWSDVSTGSISVNTTYQLVNVSLAGCNRLLPGSSVVVSINPTPNVLSSGTLNYCDGDTTLVNLSSGIVGTTFSWTVSQNGTSGAIAGTGSQIAQTLTLNGNTAGTATYTVTPLYNGCTGTPVNIIVTVHPVPVPTITDGVICTTGSGSSQFYTLDTHLNPAGHSFQWFFGTSPIPGASASTYVATQIGLYTVIATNAAGCVSDPVQATVGQMPQGESLIIQHSPAFSDDPMVTVIVTGGGGPFSYQLDQGAFQPSNTFYNVSAGTHTITVVDEFCTNLTGSVTILDYPKYFTPNEDGYHDTWNIKGIDDAVIRIFDRYGKLLKQISPEGSGWDGTYNGHLLPSTDYWFTIDYAENGSTKTFKAHFSLKR